MSAEQRLAEAFLTSHPARAALVLERMPAPHGAAVLRSVPPHRAATALRAMIPTVAARVLTHLEAVEASPILAALPTADATVIMRSADPSTREIAMASLPEETRESLARALAWPDDTAGAVMDPSIFQVADDVLVADARTRLRRAAHELLYYIYVTDRGHRLVGVLDIPELMLARARDPVRAAMRRDVERLPARLPVALVREHPGWQRFHAMPVVDESDRLAGAIRYQTLRRLERAAAGHEPDPSLVTARALGELFQLGTTGMVAAVAASASGDDNDHGSGAAAPVQTGGLHAS